MMNYMINFLNVIMSYMPNKILLLVLIVGINCVSCSNNNKVEKLLQETYQKDQEIRKTVSSLMLVNSPNLIDTLKKMEQMDKQNQEIVLPIMDRYLNDEVKLSKEALKTFYIVVQHADNETQNKYQDLIKKLYKEEVISNLDYARFIDRLLVSKHKSQVIGCQSRMNAYTQDPFPYPVVLSDSLRKEMDMMDVKNELDSSYNDEYTPIYVTPSEFVVFGHILTKDGENSYKGVSSISIDINGNYSCYSGSKGFYKIKIKKSDFPLTIVLSNNKSKKEFEFQYEEGTDWIVCDFLMDLNYNFSFFSKS